jgi:hypothetical protein
MPEKIQWLPILVELGESVIARIIESSPDTKAAIMEARHNFVEAEKEAAALRRKGHETES